MTYELYHHGILGQRWGIRRYQNKDGTLTLAGRKRKIQETSNQTLSKRDAERINQVISTMSDDDKRKLNIRGDKIFTNEWERRDVVFSLISKHEKAPVSFLYMEGPQYTLDTSANIVAGTDPKYRRQGLTSNAVEKGIEWFNNNPSLSRLEWRAYVDNPDSIRLARLHGFTVDERYSSVNDLVLTMEKDAKSTRRAKKLANKKYKSELREWKRERRRRKKH